MRALLFACCLLPVALAAQTTCGGATPFQILHFTNTDGFDHNTRNQSAAMFTAIGSAENFTIVNTEDTAAFNDLTTLLGYEVLIFSNTSGNVPFSATQRMNLENYVAGGGAVLGIHAATDMYRDASYPFFTKLIGGSRRNSPAHTSSSNVTLMDHIGNHPSTTNLPNPWNKQEEYYFWPDTGLVATIVEVLRVRDTRNGDGNTGNNGPYDDPRPISWHQTFASGARSFYTALGHARSNYTDANNDFRQHLRDALCWCVEATSSTLPLTILDSRLETTDGLHQISWEVGANEFPSRVELHGGYDQASAGLLTIGRGPLGSTGHLTHHPADPTRWFYYRLRFLDADGLPSWGPWLAAAPQLASEARPQVQYADGRATLLLPPNGPTAAWIVDATGRQVGQLQLSPGHNALPSLRPGVYFIKFPFQGQSLRFLAN